jgi:hypothetical protein
VYDPFGHRWVIMTRVEDLSPEEASAGSTSGAAAQA